MKLTCTDYVESTDTFVFTKEVETVGGAVNRSKVEMTGSQLFDLGHKAINQCSPEQIACYTVYHRHFEDVPQDMFGMFAEV